MAVLGHCLEVPAVAPRITDDRSVVEVDCANTPLPAHEPNPPTGPRMPIAARAIGDIIHAWPDRAVQGGGCVTLERWPGTVCFCHHAIPPTEGARHAVER
jgi:hypothetical protein